MHFIQNLKRKRSAVVEKPKQVLLIPIFSVDDSFYFRQGNIETRYLMLYCVSLLQRKSNRIKQRTTAQEKNSASGR